MNNFIPPILDLKSKRMVELNFNSAIPTLTNLTLVSSPISYPFKILKVEMIFTEEANNLITHTWLTSGNRGVSVTGLPSGFNIFGRENPFTSFVGKSLIKNINCDVEVLEPLQHIKLHTYNGTTYVYMINCSITIQEI